ncbi:3-dehydroquinate dehydratase [Schaalia cardiffensis F0333]|uniref:3-dehydroquinate dehydratase n=1 Tax=Schaalia cardiffensis F0333 TaxID=888050 RepID=N6W5P2_9ACTO|nr:3-dehydroquinate dehydratase [Schaalia cardiffensis F0333]
MSGTSAPKLLTDVLRKAAARFKSAAGERQARINTVFPTIHDPKYLS